MILAAVFVGGIRPLPPEGQSTGMFKTAVTGLVEAGPQGLAGDVQADRRVHGGPEKAVHHYPAGHYRRLALAFPECAALLIPGVLGENLSTEGMTEESVCLGDVLRMGGCVLQVSQPRRPCWKINHRLGEPGAAQFITEHGITGWYYRVLEPGTLGPGDTVELLARNPEPVSLARLWQASLEPRPDPSELEFQARTPGLTPAWAKRLEDRARWLRDNA